MKKITIQKEYFINSNSYATDIFLIDKNIPCIVCVCVLFE